MKKLYLVVDMQNDFVDGALGFEEAPAVVGAIVDTLKHKMKENDGLIFTRDTHHENYMETQEGKYLPVPHCIKDTHGWEIVDALQSFIKEDTLIFDKPTFGSHDLGVYLKDHAYDEIEIMGLVSNICVISNAVIAKAALPEARIVVDPKLTSSFDKTLDKASMEVMKGFQIDVKGF